MLETIFTPGAVIPDAGRFLNGVATDMDPDIRQFVSKNTDTVIFACPPKEGQSRSASFCPAKYVPWVNGKINSCETGHTDGISSRFSGCRFVKYHWRTPSGAQKTYYAHVNTGGALCCKKMWRDIKGWDRSFTVIADFNPSEYVFKDEEFMSITPSLQAELGGPMIVVGIITRANQCFSVAGVLAAAEPGAAGRSYHVKRVYKRHSDSLHEILT